MGQQDGVSSGVSHTFVIQRRSGSYWDFKVDSTVKGTLTWADQGAPIEAGLEAYDPAGSVPKYNSSSLRYTLSEGSWTYWAGYDGTILCGAGMCGGWEQHNVLAGIGEQPMLNSRVCLVVGLTMVGLLTIGGCGRDGSTAPADGIQAVDAVAQPPACEALIGQGQLAKARHVLKDQPATRAGLARWFNGRHGGLSAPIDAYPALKAASAIEPLRVCVFETEAMAPPGPPLPSGQQRPAADGIRVVVRANGDVTVEAIGPKDAILQDTPGSLTN